jgi:hypothetical protein
MVSNASIIQKADLGLSEFTSGGGKLLPEQSKTFWRETILSANILKLCTVKPIVGTEAEEPKIGMDGWTLAPSGERTALSEEDRSKPDLGKTTFQTKTFKAEFSLSYEQLEENIEGGTFQQTVQQMGAQAIARDMSVIILRGDTSITATDKRTRALKQLDGVLKQLTLNTYNAGGVRLAKPVMEVLYRKLPTQWRERDGLACLTSTIAASDFANAQANRQTPAGDDMLSKLADAKHGRIPIVGIGTMPEDLGSGNKTNAILGVPKDIIVAVSKEVTVEIDKDIRSSEVFFVYRVKFDVKVRHAAAWSKGTEILAEAA